MINLEKWMKRYNELEEFVEETGRKPSHTKGTPRETNLGYWLKDQKRDYKNGKLYPELYQKIEKLLENAKRRIDISWDDTYDEFCEFLEDNNGNAPKRGQSKLEDRLSYWMKDQRKFYDANKLSEARIKKLDDLEELYGFEWKLKRDDKEEKLYNQLEKHISETGEIPTEGPLKDYIDRRYIAFSNIGKDRISEKQNEKLTKRKEQFEELGIKYLSGEEKKKERWKNNYNLLSDYVSENDGKFPTKGKLAAFLIQQRKDYVEGKLSAEQITLLNKLGQWYKTKAAKDDEAWLLHYIELIDYREDHNGWYPSTATEEGRWYFFQRKYAKEGKLRPDRKEMMDELGDWQKGNGGSRRAGFVNQEKWNKNCSLLEQYIDEHGERPKTTDPELGNWIVNQKTLYRQGKLSKDRMLKLENLLGDWIKENTRQKVKSIKSAELSDKQIDNETVGKSR